jgi:protein-tyrosine phosphatase
MSSDDLPVVVRLHGATNFRDLGGYTTTGGAVRGGEVYRSGRLAGLTDADIAALEGLGIRTVVTLLTADDVDEYGPDRLPPGARLVELPINSDTAKELAKRARVALSTGDFSSIPPELNLDIHRLLIDDGREQYGQLIRLISDPANRPLVFHCSHGVHRTGTAAAIVLSLLGVGWATVRDDYLASNRVRAEEVEHRLDQMRSAAATARSVDPSDIDITNMEAFMVQDGTYIDASRDQVMQEHASFEAYANAVLGLSDAELQQLRNQLVTPEH